MPNVQPIPPGFHTITPYMIVDGAEAAIELYQKAFGAEVISVHRSGDGKVINAQMKIGTSMLMLNDEFPEWGAIGPRKIGNTAVTIHLYVEDAQAVWDQAIAAGFEPSMPIGVQPWGDLYGSMKDPFGHSWSVASHVEDVPDEEFERRMKEMGM